MISLIINADDLGINSERDRGILEAFRHGIVTSASLLANGASFGTAVIQTKAAGLPVGVHLNLSDGRTLTGPIAGLTDAQGNLPGKSWLRRHLAADGCNLSAIRTELSAQIAQVLQAGLQPDHLDGHQHCQIYPPLTDMIIELAREYGIPALRSSLPADPCDATVPEDLNEEMRRYRRFGRKAHTLIIASGIKSPQGLWGLPLLHSLDTPGLCLLLENLSSGCWELMTHPGYPYPQGRPFEGVQRQVELRALLSAEAREVVTRRRIRLQTFAELPCAF
ncbi:MAG: ChbG/HpnK family deacetylase [Desulfuromonadales bacterium]|nr:ChbG/HpnK family deacetylase [Desulfuromonadales bacterium]